MESVLNTYHPEIVLANAGANSKIDLGPLIMDAKDLYEIHKSSPEATIIATHMEAMNHWSLSRDDLRTFAVNNGFSDKLLIPADGELYRNL